MDLTINGTDNINDSNTLTQTEDFLPTTGVISMSRMRATPDYDWLFITFYCLRNIQAFFGLAGNIFIVISVAKFSYLQTSNNVLIVSLAVADILANLSAPFTAALSSVSSIGDTWKIVCHFKSLFDRLGKFMNNLNIFVISLDRVMSITFPIKYLNIVNMKLAQKIVVFIWLFGVLLNAPLVLAYASKAVGVCLFAFYAPSWAYKGVDTGIFWILTVLTVIFYCKIADVAFKKSAVQKNTQSTSTLQKKQKQQRQILLMMGTVIGIYLILNIPALIVSYVKQRRDLWYLILQRFLYVVYQFNYVVNPYIYAMKDKGFQKAFRTLLQMKSRHISPEEGNSDVSMRPDAATQNV